MLSRCHGDEQSDSNPPPPQHTHTHIPLPFISVVTLIERVSLGIERQISVSVCLYVSMSMQKFDLFWGRQRSWTLANCNDPSVALFEACRSYECCWLSEGGKKIY